MIDEPYIVLVDSTIDENQGWFKTLKEAKAYAETITSDWSLVTVAKIVCEGEVQRKMIWNE